MIFYSGFSLKNESCFFDNWLNNSHYSVAGFSYGAIKAAHHAAHSTTRIDTLQLFSPAFFQTAKSSFKRLQLASFTSDPEHYRERFVHGCFAPCEVQPLELKMGTVEELQELLDFIWDDLLLENIVEKGIRVEVYLGMKDHIIDAAAAHAFFLKFATVTSLPKANHFLQECK